MTPNLWLYAKDRRQFRKMLRLIKKSEHRYLVDLRDFAVVTTHEGREYILENM